MKKEDLYNFCVDLFPICRSITGNGVRETLSMIQSLISGLTIQEVPTGTKAFDWEVPKEWNIHDAYIIDPKGQKFCEFSQSNLHIVGYSAPVDQVMPLETLQEHLHSLPGQPDAIPYITSYYKENWGFCLPHNFRQSLIPGNYRVLIDSELTNGHLTYGELILPGESTQEIFLSTYICHPSMANNELSGPAVTTHIAKWLKTCQNRYYTYRIIFIPETIGSIVYLSRNLPTMQKNMIAGFNVTCVGDNGNFSYLSSRYGNTLADRVAKHILKYKHPDFIEYSFLERGSDERQYCSPGVDLPVVSIMRSKYGEYPEYHTSLDNLEFISSGALTSSFNVLKTCIESLELNNVYQTATLCEPQLGKRGLYPSLSTKGSNFIVCDMMNLIAYCDGNNDLLAIAEIINVPIWELFSIVDKLVEHGLLLMDINT